MLVTSEEGLRALVWEKDSKQKRVQLGKDLQERTHPILTQTQKELDEYFAGKRKTFSLPLDPVGTPFQQKVWLALRKIPYGETKSYGEQAKMIGKPTASRAVGSANGRNPISIIVPCHRVISKSGDLTGFGGGLSIKRKLLELEGIAC